jgi:hypothetical protein
MGNVSASSPEKSAPLPLTYIHPAGDSRRHDNDREGIGWVLRLDRCPYGLILILIFSRDLLRFLVFKLRRV